MLASARWYTVLLFSLWSGNVLSQETYKLMGKPDGGYYVQIDIGTPPSQFNVLVDTGSSNFAIAARSTADVTKYFDSANSSTFLPTGDTIKVSYTQGGWNGVLGSDSVKLSNGGLSPVQVDFALIEESKEFFVNGSGWQGIIGLGYRDIAIATADNVKPSLFFDHLVQSGQVANGFGMALCGPAEGRFSDDIPVGGNLTLGLIDQSLYTGSQYRAKIVKEGYYQILVSDVKVNGVSLGLDCVEYNTDKSIVDSGTTNLRLPTKVFNAFVPALKGSVRANVSEKLDDRFWRGEVHACISHQVGGEAMLYNVFPSIELDLMHDNNTAFSLVISPQQYLRPVQSTNLGEDCYKVGITTSTAGTVIGAVIMEGFYIYFDRDNRSISFAETTCKPRIANSMLSSMKGYKNSSYDMQSCLYVKPVAKTGLPAYGIALIVIFTFLSVFVLALAILKVISKRKRRQRRLENEIAFHGLVDNSFDTEY